MIIDTVGTLADFLILAPLFHYLYQKIITCCVRTSQRNTTTTQQRAKKDNILSVYVHCVVRDPYGSLSLVFDQFVPKFRSKRNRYEK